MSDARDFDIFVDWDVVHVRFVSRVALGALPSGHGTIGDWDGATMTIRLARWETTRTLLAALLHELGHYFVARSELNPRGRVKMPVDVTEEDVCGLLEYLPMVLLDERNERLRAVFGLQTRRSEP